MKYLIIHKLKIEFLIASISILLACCEKDEKMINLNNWQTIYQDTTMEMLGIRFLDQNTGFVLAGNTLVLDSLRGRVNVFKTTDAGKTWTKFACLLPSYNDNIGNFIAIDNHTLLGIGTSIYKSSDNGYSWINLYPEHVSGCGIWDISLIDSLHWELADCSFITQTTDGGKTWFHSFKNDSFPAPFSLLSFPSSTNGYACGGASYDNQDFGFIAMTTNGGQSWAYINPEPWHSKNRTFPDINDLQFINEQIGFIFTIKGEIYKTYDGGNNWKLISKLPNVYSGYFMNENVGYCTDESHIYGTRNGGKTWNISYLYSSPNHDVKNIFDMFFLKSGEGYAITRNGIIIKLINP